MISLLLEYFKDPVISLGLLAFCFLLLALPFSFWFAAVNKKSSFVINVTLISNLLIASQLTIRWIQSGHFPVSNLYESLYFLAWAFTFFQLFLARLSKSAVIDAILTPFSLLTIAFASFILPEQLQASAPLVPALRSSWLVMHVTVIMCSYAALILGSLLSIYILFLSNSESFKLRSSSFDVGFVRDKKIFNKSDLIIEDNLDPIEFSDSEQFDTLSYRIITLGFLLLTFGLISGAVWANEAWGTWWSWDPKETWAFITWLVYAGYLHSRITKGWQGKKPAIIALIGLFVILVCYLGVNFLGIGLHSYGWFL